MRRKEKEITERSQIEAILKRAKMCRVAFFDNEYPYMVPLCFGFDGQSIWFHGFNGGKKMECLRKNPRVCFEVEEDIEIVENPDPCEWTVKYRSVVGFGTATIVEETEAKRAGLDVIVTQFAGHPIHFPDQAMAAVAVVRIDIESMTGRRNGYTE
ncbi:MAG TPA: pyridoxamine 5'-phosphate oxidase family protein [Synergistales bacterium]|nr:pyridoxamine 5'-phosphate oxidase family protein [Synergistales bacterium]HRV71719.1 pyridoxamine 5'-phosphate oxidase family protein [Thermovirgaceae bacterium]